MASRTYGSPGSPITIANSTTTTHTLFGLTDGVQYFIAVKAYDASGNESAFSDEVTFPNNVLAANFTATPTSGPAPLTVIFTSTSTGNPTASVWDFDDGSTGNQSPITHTFTSPRTYNVKLTISAGSLSNTVTKPITVSQQPTASPGLVAAYSFNEGSGTTANDSSGNGNHGTISGADWTTNGHSGSALSFGGNDGNNDRVTTPASASLDLTSNMTLEAWVFPTTVSNWRTVIAKGTSGNLVYYLYANSDSNTPVVGGLFGSTPRNLSGGTQLPTNVWTHLAGTYDGSSQRLYVNGVEVANRQQTGQMQLSSSVLRIGGNRVSNQYFRGRIDEVRVYNRALEAFEIQSNMGIPVGSAASSALTVQNQGIQLNTSSISSTLGQSTTPFASSKQQTANGSSALNITTTNTTTTDLLTSDHLEVGELAVDHQWKRVDLSKPFTDPVVVAKAISARDAAPAVVGIRQIDATGFELRLWPWADSSQSRSPETVGYLVIERGRFRLADGTSVESGTIDTNAAHPAYSLAFAQPFQSAPVVITALVNIPDQTAVTGWPTRISEKGFQFQLHPQGSSPSLDAVQSVGYVAWERSTGTLGGLTFEVDRAKGVTPGQFSPLTFKEVFAGPPVFLADVQSGPGGSPINVRWEHKDLGGVDVTIDDESDLAADGAKLEDRQDVGYILIQ